MAQKIGEIGDKNPIEYGGGFIFGREGSVLEWFEGLDGDPNVESQDLNFVDPFNEPDEDDDEETVAAYEKLMSMKFDVYVVPLYDEGGEFLRHYDWVDWSAVARSTGQSMKTYTEQKLSTVKSRAAATYDLARHYGWHELDHYPLRLTLGELIERWDL